MKKIIETERLYLREFTINEAQLLIDLNSDPEVIKYTGNPVIKDLIEARKVLEEIILPQYKNKIGRWAVFIKTNNEFIGWCGLKEIDGELDLGYRFIQKHWGNGYATESAKAVLDYAKTMGLKNIIAQAAKENSASIHVIKKLGMVFLKEHLCEQYPAETYILK